MRRDKAHKGLDFTRLEEVLDDPNEQSGDADGFWNFSQDFGAPDMRRSCGPPCDISHLTAHVPDDSIYDIRRTYVLRSAHARISARVNARGHANICHPL